MYQNDIKPIFIILLDISGYTRFIKIHKVSLLHAEKIIGELMESILDQVEVPVMAHEILGDAISLYAIDEKIPGQADKIYEHLHDYFKAFWKREAHLISECSLCSCTACMEVGKLKLKAILHYGEAVFTKVHNIQKISGSDVIMSHRLLKNSILSKEYILMTENFVNQCSLPDTKSLNVQHEKYEDIGEINIFVKNFEDTPLVPANISFWKKLRTLLRIDGYMISRLWRQNLLKYNNLPN